MPRVLMYHLIKQIYEVLLYSHFIRGKPRLGEECSVLKVTQWVSDETSHGSMFESTAPALNPYALL